MKITKKQAREYIEDRKNWRLVQDGNLVKVYQLDFGNLHYLDIVKKYVSNTVEVLLGREEPKTDFTLHDYYSFNPEAGAFDCSARITGMTEEIWEEAKNIR